MIKLQRILAGAALAMLATLAHAQYIWIDEKGIKQLSDRPPPPSTPAKNILKQPAGTAPIADPAPAAAPAASAAAASAAASAPMTVAEREADYRKRQEEKAEKDKKAAEEARQKLAQKVNCDIARNYMAQLQSGERIGVMGANAQRGFMSDAERSRKAAETSRILQGCR